MAIPNFILDDAALKRIGCGMGTVIVLFLMFVSFRFGYMYGETMGWASGADKAEKQAERYREQLVDAGIKPDD